MRRILLVEPSYRNKYPPLGLMKLSSYHKLRNDYVKFVKGCDASVREQHWDRIYVSTLFTFYWKTTIETIRYYLRSVSSPLDMVAGGVMATLMGQRIEQECGIQVIRGLLDKPGMLDPDDKTSVDSIVPDYTMLEDIDYAYGLGDAYIGYGTRGCPNNCSFCAVNSIEPEFIHYLPLKIQVESIESIHGPKQHLVLLDNNVLASNQFGRLISDIRDLGFQKGAVMNRKQRHVDFNQGIDLRLLTEDKADLLAQIALRPMRLALDNQKLIPLFLERAKMALDKGIRNISTYVLYNYTDTPEDFYERLRSVVLLNEREGTQIYSFPMKYIPLDATDRSYVGPNWNRRILRGIQCVLVKTKGMVSPKRSFFEAAFGSSPSQFLEIVLMPDEYIINRERHKLNGASEWKATYRALAPSENLEFMEALSAGKVSALNLDSFRRGRVKDLLAHYVEAERLEKTSTT